MSKPDVLLSRNIIFIQPIVILIIIFRDEKDIEDIMDYMVPMETRSVFKNTYMFLSNSILSFCLDFL